MVRVILGGMRVIGRGSVFCGNTFFTLLIMTSACGGQTDKFDAQTTKQTEDTDETDAKSSDTNEATDDEATDTRSTDVDAKSPDDAETTDTSTVEPEEDCEEGSERCFCYPNDTCNDDLACLSGLCVDASNLAGEDESGSSRSSPVETDSNSPSPSHEPDPGPAQVLDEPQLPPPTAPVDETIGVEEGPTEDSVADGTIGSSCGTDTDCGSGFFCLAASSSDWLGGGAPGGYCSRNCMADPGVCSAAGGICLEVNDTEAYCLEACEVGSSATECHGRGDTACDDVSIDTGFCRPMCGSDADCGGRHCDVGTGACFDQAFGGDPIGAKCDPDAEVSTCASGICLPVTDTFASCSGLCNLSQVGCGSDDATPEDPGAPFCRFGTVADSGPQDLGLCSQRCDCDDDCLHPDALCLVVPSLEVFLGTTGLCVNPDYLVGDSGYTLGKACQ